MNELTIAEICQKLGEPIAMAQLQILQLEKQIVRLQAENAALKNKIAASGENHLSPEAVKIADEAREIIRGGV